MIEDGLEIDRLEVARMLVYELQSLFRLDQWVIRIAIKRTDSGTKGETTSDDEWMCAQITLSDELPLPHYRHTIAHEMAHISLSAYKSLIEKALEELPGSSAIPLAKLLDEEEERLCNRIASVTAPGEEPFNVIDENDGVSFRTLSEFRKK